MSEKKIEETTNKTVQMQIDELTEATALQKAEIDRLTAENTKILKERDDANAFLEGQIRANLLMKLRGKTNIPATNLEKMGTVELKAMSDLASQIKTGITKSIHFATDAEDINPQDLYRLNQAKLEGK